MRQATSVKVYRPIHVPNELHKLWHEVATHLATKRKLIYPVSDNRNGLRASGTGSIDYKAINSHYLKVLTASYNLACRVSQKRFPRVAKIINNQAKIKALNHVPKEMRPLWYAAAKYTASKSN